MDRRDTFPMLENIRDERSVLSTKHMDGIDQDFDWPSVLIMYLRNEQKVSSQKTGRNESLSSTASDLRRRKTDGLGLCLFLYSTRRKEREKRKPTNLRVISHLATGGIHFLVAIGERD